MIAFSFEEDGVESPKLVWTRKGPQGVSSAFRKIKVSTDLKVWLVPFVNL